MLSVEWEQYAEEQGLDVNDQKLRSMFEWAWHTAVNECCSFLIVAGQVGISNMLQDHMTDKNWEYEEDEEET
jgi:hypothetical protein